MIFLPSFGGPSLLCLPFSADNEQLLCRKQGSRGFPLEQITHAALCDTGTRRWCPAAPSQPSPALLNIWGVQRTQAVKIPAPCQKWQPPPGPSWHLHWVKSLNQKYTSSAIPAAWGKGGKGTEGRLHLFLFANSEMKGLGWDFLPNILDARLPLMGNENVNYLG